MKRLLVVLAAFWVVVAVSGCGDRATLKVSAASSLRKPFEQYAEQFNRADTTLSFAGSDELAAQIEQGAKPDVFASANTKLPDQLYAKGLVEKPEPFATNRLVIAVPADNSEINSLDDLAADGVKIAAGSPAVPVGSYTRKVLDGLSASQRAAVERNIRSNEPDVSGVAAKVDQGAVDAGFVYISDVKASKGTLKAVEIPARLEPNVTFAAAVVKGTNHRDDSQAFVDGLVNGQGADDLRADGFGPPPGQ